MKDVFHCVRPSVTPTEKMGMPAICSKGQIAKLGSSPRPARSGQAPPVLKATEHGEKDDCAGRCHDDRRQIETLGVLEAKQAAEGETAAERADDADDKVSRQAMMATRDPLGEPASKVPTTIQAIS